MEFDNTKHADTASTKSSAIPPLLLGDPTTAQTMDRDYEDTLTGQPTDPVTVPPSNTPTSEPAASASLLTIGSPLSLSTSMVPTAMSVTTPVPPAPTPVGSSGTTTNAASSPYAPPMNQISMPYIKRHAVKRVKSAKEACNTELQKVIHSITNYFEERLGEREREEAEEQYAKAQMQQQYMREQQIYAYRQESSQSGYGGSDDGASAHHSGGTQSSHLVVGSPAPLPPAELHAAIQQLHAHYREGQGDGMTDADDRPLTRANSRRTADAPSRSHSRQPSMSGTVNLRKTGSLHGKVPHSAPVSAPNTTQLGSGEQSPNNRSSNSIYQPTPTSLASQANLLSSNVSSSNIPSSAPLPQPVHAPQPHSQQQIRSSNRVSRHMFVPNQPSANPPSAHSEISSRSTSRSRSPMPFSQAPTEQATPSSSSPRAANRRLSRHMDSLASEPPQVDPFISTLHDLITVCTDITETSASALTSKPGIGGELVRKVQEVGRAWDEHPDWYGRTWYITVLLAVATLARVVEWFEAERQFWRFEEEEGEDGESEPLTFVLKPEFDNDGYMSGREGDESAPKTPVAATSGDDNPLRLSRTGDESRRMSRDERVPQKDLRGGILVGDQGSTPSLGVPSTSGGRTSPLLAQPDALTQRPISRDFAELSVMQGPGRPHEVQRKVSDLGKAQAEPALPPEALRIEASEHLRQKADKAKSSNILMELNLDGEHFLYINRTWSDVIGSDPDTLVNTGMGISPLLHPDDAHKFKEASDKLQSDDSHTVEIQFRMRIEPDYDDAQDLDQMDNTEPVYLDMEGSGMLMLDRVEQIPSHTMWVIKPGPETPSEDENELLRPEPATGLAGRTPTSPFRFPLNKAPTADSLPIIKSLSATPILCRICENQIPSWFFEKHNETCNEVHKFEADIAECNESISELRNTVRELISGIEKLGLNIEKAIPERPPLEYRGMSISAPQTTTTTNSPIQVFRPPLASRMQRVGVRKAQQKLLEQMEEMLTLAGEISVPGLKEEESKEPIERQRLLSPNSEDRIGKCITWVKPAPEDPALLRLAQDVDFLIKQKLDTVMRMQNTVRYEEKIRQEWLLKYEEAVAASVMDTSVINDTVMEEPSESALQDEEDDGASSTTSEYNFERGRTSTEPTPVASSPAPPATPLPLVPIMPVPVPATYQGVGAHKHSRSSTPSSVTSPLAIAAPINAGTTPEGSLVDRAALLAAVEDSAQTIRARRTSMQNLATPSSSALLEPKLLVTPPVSPSLGSLGIATGGHARRLSIAQPILSPTVAVAPGPHHGRLPSVAPSKAAPSSIKDFEIIKPISKGAFGSVFLAKKKTTGDYYAIKVLKKSDMIAKNQVTNVKAERMILMKQAESPFVVKLYFTFQSKDNLYLVMEYLNGGDCAALIKTLGSLPEEWTRAYVAEVVLGLEFLHGRGIVHRDLKPDNLLIDQHGHLKLTDFGLSRIGLLGRQTRESRRLPERLLGGKNGRGRRSPGSRPTSFDSGYLQSPLLSAKIEDSGSYFNPRMAAAAQLQDDVSESSGSEGVAHLMWKRGKQTQADSPLQSFASELASDLRLQQGGNGSTATHSGNTPPGEGEKKFVGTPDYLAPETILGLSEDDRSVDWWALGVVTYEFLYGMPPFHAETPDKVFENILSMRIDWHEEWIEFSQEARNFMERLLVFDPTKRLGYNGAKEVKAHQFFETVEWDKVMQSEPQFVPQVTDPESTDYFDPRGAIPQLFQEDETIALGRPPSESAATEESPSKAQGSSAARGPLRDAVATPAPDDFGTFNFKNLPVLKQANDEVIKKLKSEQMAAVTQVMGDAALMQHHRRRSMSRRINKPANVLTNFEPKGNTNPPSPSTSVSSIASSPSRGSMGPSTPGSIQAHIRRPSEYSAVDRFKMNQMDHDSRRNSMPSRLRTASVSSSDQDPNFSNTESWTHGTATSASPAPLEQRRTPEMGTVDRAVVCLIAEDNPISAKILETLLVRLGCRCIMAADGAEAISTAHGDIKFDIILMDYHMPVVDGESAARYIKSTNNLNKSTPIIAVSAYVGQDSNVASNLFAACIAKPVHKTDLLNVLRSLGFRTSTAEGPKQSTQVAKVAVAVS